MSTTTNAAAALQHLVVPGQLIAVSAARIGGGVDSTTATTADDSFLRGHGTYLETTAAGEHRLYASTVGMVQRVNKLVSVVPVSATTFYRGQVGDLVVGRITAVANGRWKVDLGSTGKPAMLPLQGVHLPGGVQRIRTQEDALDMRQFLQEGDLVSAEVHKVVAERAGTGSSGTSSGGGGGGDGSGTLRLHTRSIKYGKLENGCLVQVPPSLIQRRKSHYTEIINGEFQVLWGCNGMIWIQRNVVQNQNQNQSMNKNEQPQELAELQEQRQREHAAMPYSLTQRQDLARLRNAVLCLRLVYCMVTPESVERIFKDSKQQQPTMKVSQMLWPENVISLTAFTRK